MSNLAVFAFGLMVLIRRHIAVAFWPLLGAFMGVYVFLAVGVDGTITESAGVNVGVVVVNPIVTASTTSFAWITVLLIPLFLILMNFMWVLLRGLRKI
jgi:hypothetical protein